MKASSVRNLLIPSIEHFTKMGLRRSIKYVSLTYPQLLEKYKFEHDPLATPSTEHLKKAKDYAERAHFIVPTKEPTYDTHPIHRPRNPASAIDLGSHDLLLTFVSYFFSTAKWDIPENGSIQPYLEEISSIAVDIDATIIKKAIRWTNQFGALFTAPAPETRIENIYNRYEEQDRNP